MINLNDLYTRLKESKDNQVEYYLNGKKLIKKFSEVYVDVAKVAAWLASKNIGKGDRVGILGKNSYEWIIIDLACVLKGIITIPFDPNREYDVKELEADFDLVLFFTNLPAYTKTPWGGVISFEDCIREADSFGEVAEAFIPVAYTDTDIFTVVSTSGTVGRSKYIEIKKGSFDNLVTETHQLYQFTSRERFLVFLPLNIYLERCYVYSAILLEFSIILTPLEFVFHSIQHDRPSVIIGIPYFFETFHTKFLQRINEKALYKALYKGYLWLHKVGLGSLTGNRFAPFIKAWGGNIRYLLTGSAPIRKDTLEFYQKMGITIYEGYGLSEIGGMITLNSPGNMRIGSVGKPFPGKEVYIDHAGQVIVKSPYNANTRYFLSTQEENDRTYLPDGEVATGDMGYFDKEGFLYLNGRIKDLIVSSSGKKVHPTSIEERIIKTGLFANCIVYGDNKPFLVSVVVPKDRSVAYEEILQEFRKINATLSADERIVRFVVHPESFTIDNGLLTTSLKLNRKKIIEKFANQINELYN